MARRSFAIRHLKFAPPDEETAGKYLLVWHTGELHHNLPDFPSINSQSFFGNEHPLEIEVGCGTGEFLCTLAAANPEANFIGFDISLKALYIAVHNARALRLENIRFVKAAIQFVYPLLAPESLSAIYLHFPDPCLHPKYRKRRIFNASFLDHAHRALVEGGRISVMTDVPVLFDLMLEVVEGDSRFAKTHLERYLVGFDAEVKSRYQAIWERHGTSPLRFEVSRR